jgi:TP901 family phage tail tape measure protein
MSIQSRDLVVRLMAQSNGFEKGMKSAAASADVFAKELEKIDRRQTEAVAHVARLRAKSEREAAAAEKAAARDAAQATQRRMDAYDRLGKSAMIAGTAVAAGVALSVKAAVQWESAWAGVAKTVEGNVEQMAALEGELRQLATTLPATHTEIAAVAEAAGQLGIKREAIAGFTKVMIDLGETTNLTADEAATSMAQLANIMGTSAQDVDRMGAALVALGNNGASTEADIVQMALRIAGAGKQVGLTEADVLAMSNALASVGINAEAGGSAISRFMSDLSVAVVTGSSSLEGFADVAGMSVQEFSTLFEQDAARAVGAFTDGLGRIQASGGSAIATLEEMDITELRLRDTLLRLAGAQGMLGDSLELGTEAWEANLALTDEADKRYATTEAKLQIARNAVNDMAIDLGSTLLPALADVASGVGDMATMIANLPGPVKAALAIVATFAATVGIVGGAALIAVPKLAAMRLALTDLGLSAAATDRSMKALTLTMKAAGLVSLLAGAAVAADALTDALAGSGAPLNAMTEDLVDFASRGRLAGDLAKTVGADFSELADKIDKANETKWSGIEALSPLWAAKVATDIQTARNEVDALDQAFAGLVQSGQELVVAQFFEQWSQESGRSVEDLSGDFDAYQEALAGARVETKLAADGTGALVEGIDGVGVSTEQALSSITSYAEALGYSEDASKELTKQIEEWAKSYAGFIEPLGSYTTLLSEKQAAERESAEATAAATSSQTDSWEDYAKAVKVSVGEYLAELEKQVQAQQDWSANMLTLSSRVSEGTLDELARMGPEGAPLVAALVNASDAELARLEDAFGARTAAATGAMASELRLAQPVLTTVAKIAGQKTADALARELAAGKTTVAKIAADYGIGITGGIVPPVSRAAEQVRSLARGLEGLDGRNVNITVRTNYVSSGVPRQVGVGGGLQQRDGGVVDFFSAGGLREQHVAQIAPAGAWRVWAEPETGGEAYIPLAPSKRRRSVEIWQETGRRLQMFASGGIAGAGATNPTGGRPLSVVAAGMTSIEQIRALVDAWKDYNEQLADAARRQELVLGEQAARKAFDLAKGMKERTKTLEDLKDAQKRLREFDAAAAIDRERRAVDKILDTLEAEEKAREAAARAAEELAQERRRATEAAEDAQERALDRLNRLLDTEKALRGRQIQAEQRHAADRARLATRAAQTDARFASDQAKVRADQVDAERRHLERLAMLRVQLATDEARLLDDRRDRLANSTALDQMIAFERGLPADWLVANARRQVEALTEWIEELDLARRMGVSEQVIAALGLDDGPQTLAQVRALTRASAQEIAALNDAAEQRTRLAGEKVRREQVGNYGQLGQALASAQLQYTNAVRDLQAQYQVEQERFAIELLELQTEYVTAQQQISDELAASQAALVAEQAELAAELAVLGQDQGRAYGEALAEGLRSQIPGVRAAAAELAAAMAVLAEAQAAQASPATTPSTPGTTNSRPAPAPFKDPLSRTSGSRPINTASWSADPRGELDLADPFARPGTVMYGVPRRTYDVGGWLQPGYTLAYNGTGQPERILTAQQMAGVGGRQVHLHISGNTIRESVDVDLLMHRAEFLIANGSLG